MTALWLIAAGSALGGVARYTLSSWMVRSYGAWIPWGTLAVNIAGCFAIGLIAAMVRNPTARQFLMTGFCGGFTTMSSFGFETMTLWQQGNSARALLYIGASMSGSLAAVWIGEASGKWLWQR